MIEFLLSVQLTCAEVNWILDGIEKADLSAVQRAELKIAVLENMPENCERENVRR